MQNGQKRPENSVSAPPPRKRLFVAFRGFSAYPARGARNGAFRAFWEPFRVPLGGGVWGKKTANSEHSGGPQKRPEKAQKLTQTASQTAPLGGARKRSFLSPKRPPKKNPLGWALYYTPGAAFGRSGAVWDGLGTLGGEAGPGRGGPVPQGPPRLDPPTLRGPPVDHLPP